MQWGWLDGVWSSRGFFAAAVFVVAWLGGTAIYVLVSRVLAGLVRRSDTVLDDAMAKRLRAPLRWLLPLLLAASIAPTVWADQARPGMRHAISVATILLFAWLAIAVVRLIEDVVHHRYDASVADNLRARQVHTQTRGIRNIAIFLIGVLGVGGALMTFDSVRQVGVSLLASAGLAGVVIGFAAQKSIATIVAGIQVALTQPIRVDDVVIVEGEWGRIEEIALTYVVVRIWDARRLVVPIGYFLEKPFQNWTSTSADILGSVFIHTDYTVPVDEVRAEVERIVKEDPRWDGQVCNLQVTDATPSTLELRALLSAADSSTAWDLRCHLREQLVRSVQERYPGSLPRTRAELDNRARPAG